jgi:hypothetical protein
VRTNVDRAGLLNRLTLEFSLKPFYRPDAGSFEDTACEIMTLWSDLAGCARGLSVLLWIGDGAEILEWKGDLDEPIRWGHTIGFNNLDYGLFPGAQHYALQRAIEFRDEVPTVTYADLVSVNHALRVAAHECLDRKLQIGATIDPGPEFVQNPWKYETHRELIRGGPESEHPESVAFLSVGELLHADPGPYAGYPDGIPEGTPFGEFLGRQFSSLAKTLGFDYLWLSNGMGCTHNAWSYMGELFDGEGFDTTQAAESRQSILSFWESFRPECDMPIELRGTNFGVGMDIASDAVPLRQIVREHGAAWPPNTPWGCRRLGAEMAIYLSRMAGMREGEIPVRYYLQDPWFNSDPWWVYYGREPFDAYCQAACCRLNADGTVRGPTQLELLTVDTELGDPDPEAVREVTPHLARAYALKPDAPGPLIWIYPFEDYHDMVDAQPELLDHPFFHDWFMVAAMTAGLPVSTVMDSREFAAMEDRSVLRDCVLVAPVPLEGRPVADALCDWVEAGGKALLYGPMTTAAPRVRELLALDVGEPIEGELEVSGSLERDVFPAEGKRRLQHNATLSAGGVAATPGMHPGPPRHVRVRVSTDDSERLYGVVRDCEEWNGGIAAWVRGSLAFAGRRALEPRPQDATDRFEPGEWMRNILADLGYVIRQERPDPTIRPAMLFASRHRGAFMLNGHKPDAAVTLALRFPDGAPLVSERETFVERSTSSYTFDKTIHHEVRVFVRQAERSYVKVKEQKTPTWTNRSFTVSGLKNADVTIYPYPESLRDGSFSIVRAGEYEPKGDPTPAEPDGPLVPVAEPFETDPERGCAVVRGVSHPITVNW